MLAGAVAFGLSVGEPQQYRATATVVVPSTGNRPTTPAAAGQFIANYRSVLTSPSVAQRVSKTTKVPARRIRSGLASSQSGGSIITASYTDRRPQTVGPVLQGAARQALVLLDEPRVESAKAKVAIAQTELAEAQKAVDDFRSKTGLVLPNEEYRVAAGELSQLRILLQQARVAPQPDSARIAALEKAVADATASVTQMGGEVASFKRIEDRLDRAGISLDKAEAELRDASAQLQADDAGAGISLGATVEVPRQSFIRRRVQAAAGTALILAIGFVVLLEMLKAGRSVRSYPDEEDLAVAGPSLAGSTASAARQPAAFR